MRSLKTVLYNFLFAGNILLVFLLLTDQWLVIPHWLQVVGRMHPLVLHFPLVLILLSISWELFFVKRWQASDTRIGDTLMLFAALFTMIAAIMGLLLSREPGYDKDTIWLHKWSGVILSLIGFAWYASRFYIRRQNGRQIIAGSITLFVLIIAGHEGASITHGENFLLAPVSAETVQIPVSIEDAKVYADVIQPILAAKCLGCHNSKKAKGELIMETAAALFKGGKTGLPWDSTASEFGLVLHRLHLPMEDKKHMPPKGKLQLNQEEISLLNWWIRGGADTSSRLLELDPADSVRILAAGRFAAGSDEVFTFQPASDDKIKELNNYYRLVAPVSSGSPALTVSFFGASQFNPKSLEQLMPVKEQVVSILLNKMPLKDKELSVLAQFPELRELNLSFTQVSDTGMQSLISLTQLKRLSLSGTRVTAAGLKKLAAIKTLQHLYCWNTNLTEQELLQVRKSLGNCLVENGFSGDTITIELNPPLIENDETIIDRPVKLRMKHYIKGVEIRYTTDGKEPDSLSSLVYSEKSSIEGSATLKARAFKKGWKSSVTASHIFYKRGIHPDSLRLVNFPDSGYRGKGAITLFDAVKGDNSYRSEKWLGFRKKTMDLYMLLNAPREISSIKISSLIDIGGYIMPPAEIQVWGAETGKPLRILATVIPTQPVKDTFLYQTFFQAQFNPVTVTQLRLFIKPVKKLPKWHPGKGQQGWVFADEIFIQ